MFFLNLKYEKEIFMNDLFSEKFRKFPNRVLKFLKFYRRFRKAVRRFPKKFRSFGKFSEKKFLNITRKPEMRTAP